MINYSIVALKDDALILEMMNSVNMMLHELIRNAKTSMLGLNSLLFFSVDHPT